MNTGSHLHKSKAKKVAKAAVKGHNGFDFEQIEDPELRAQLEQVTAEIRANLETQDKAFLDNGRKLISIKAALKENDGHGHWLPWLSRCFHWSERTAQNYMSVAKVLGDDYHHVSYLPSQVIYRLVAGTVPIEFRDKVIAAAKAGKPMPSEEVEAAMTVPKGNVVNMPSVAQTAPIDSVSEPVTDDQSAKRRSASEKLLQLIAPGKLQEFMRLANSAGIQLSDEFVAALASLQKAAA